ncbi:unnamed protein product [Phyllotreta striolata]|uniref:Dynein axonemal assembly factor 1 homolog n=1 Tax=Phyllotreta striolata TaxID=444603 RepID=A0A9N9XTD0_PHYSR|nr:unnamed protein product [Phyllotreta striolata]
MNTNPCKEREPKVIDSKLLQKCIEEQLPKGELGRLMKTEGVEQANVEQLRLEFLNIVKMDHLWVLKSITVLKLNNNLIEKIEDLENLIHLEDLDLSFNKITKIENLDTLGKLRILNLYENRIEKLENMQNLKSLTIFNIGKNLIKDKETVHHLRRIPNLISLNLADNPCTEFADLRIYVAAFLPTLIWFQYKKIYPEERENGCTKFKQQIIDQEELEEKELAKILQKEREDREAELNMDSFVEYLNTRHLFDKMYENDAEGKLLLNLGDDVMEAYNEFQENFVNYCREIFDIGQKHYKIRQDEIAAFFRSTSLVKHDSQQESIKYMEEFVESKNILFSKVNYLQRDLMEGYIEKKEFDVDIVQKTEEFNQLIHVTWKKLMKIELILYEQMDEVNQTFERNLKEMIANLIEESQNCFTQLRDLEQQYFERVSEVANKMFAGIGIIDDLVIPEVLDELMSDKDNVLNCLAATHDTHLTVIDTREDVLMFRAREWFDIFTKNLFSSEIDRNRYKILELNHFLDIQRDEFAELITPPKEIEIDESFS